MGTDADILQRRRFISFSRLAWALIALLTLASWLGTAALGIRILHDELPLNVLLVPAFLLVSWIYTHVRRDLGVALLFDVSAQVLALTIVANTYSYVLVRLGAGIPLVDPVLQTMDRSLGFEFASWIAWLETWPRLSWLLSSIYESFGLQAPFIVICLVAARRYERLQTMMIALLLCIVVGLTFAIWVPALGAYHQAGLTPPAIHPSVPRVVSEILQMRGATPVIDLGRLEGIVELPSFHTVFAILYAWGLWSIRWLRWPAVLLEGAMIVATPAGGSHYLVDVLAGAALIVVGLAAAKAIVPRLGAGASRRSSVSSPPTDGSPVPTA
jgi:hypothetical protein